MPIISLNEDLTESNERLRLSSRVKGEERRTQFEVSIRAFFTDRHSKP